MLLLKSQMIRLIRPYILLLALLIGATATDAFAIKPQPPLDLALSHVTLPNGQITITLRIVANVPLNSVALLLKLPPSIIPIEGETQWEGPMAAGEERGLILLVQERSNRSEPVIGVATGHLSSGGSFVQSRTLSLHPLTDEKTPAHPPIKRRQGGETILEFQEK